MGNRWIVGLLLTVPHHLYAEVPYCPPSLEAPLEGEAEVKPLVFPKGHLFQPLIADPREPRFMLGVRSYRHAAGAETVRTGVIGFGETFQLLRHPGCCSEEGWQLDLVGGGFARFVLDDGRNDLIDADYFVGLPLSGRKRNWSWRARLYHESSHLGEDELFQAGSSARVKVSKDALDLVASYDETSWRLYFGGSYLIHHHPAIDAEGLQLGAEYYSPQRVLGESARPIIALDVKAWNEFQMEPDYSLKAGLSFGGVRVDQNHLQLLLEWYDGHANQGVNFDESVRYFGLGLYFGF